MKRVVLNKVKIESIIINAMEEYLGKYNIKDYTISHKSVNDFAENLYKELDKVINPENPILRLLDETKSKLDSDTNNNYFIKNNFNHG